MKKILTLIAAAAVSASLAGANRLNAAQYDTLFDGGTSLKLSDSRVSVPEAGAPAAAGQDGAARISGPVQGYTPAQEKRMADHNAGLLNSSLKSLELPAAGPYRPYADYEAPGYLIMSSDYFFNSRQAKLEMARNLPVDAVLVIFAENPSAGLKEQILADYGSVVDRARIKIISLPMAIQGFWARDGVPVPVLDKNNKLTVVDAVYGHGFEPDAEISRIFKTGLEKHQYYYEGGNFQANKLGDCMMVNHGEHVKIPDSIFSTLYGCRQLIRLPYVDGIGHVDERARFVNDKTIVTDTPAYKDILEAKGFTVKLLPKPAKYYETYVNSLILNDHVVMPVFGEPTDAQALAVYESLGLKASGGQSSSLSNDGEGSVHCITMIYPKVPAAELMKALGATEL